MRGLLVGLLCLSLWGCGGSISTDVADLRALLYNEKATEADRAKCLPVAKSLAKGETPKPADVQAVKDAKTEADIQQEDEEIAASKEAPFGEEGAVRF